LILVYGEATLGLGSFARAWVLLSATEYSDSKPATVPRPHAKIPIGHEHVPVPNGDCVCFWVIDIGLSLW